MTIIRIGRMRVLGMDIQPLLLIARCETELDQLLGAPIIAGTHDQGDARLRVEKPGFPWTNSGTALPKAMAGSTRSRRHLQRIARDGLRNSITRAINDATEPDNDDSAVPLKPSTRTGYRRSRARFRIPSSLPQQCGIDDCHSSAQRSNLNCLALGGAHE